MFNGKRFSREELYELVWQKPMSRLATEFNMSDVGLAKTCKKLDVPRPPRGYWARLEAGQKVKKIPLPKKKAGVPESAFISSSPRPKPDKSEPTIQISAKIPSEIEISENLKGAHPVVREWVDLHKKEKAEARSRRRGSLLGPRVPVDLTERDQYRFRVTSAYLKILQKEGVTVADHHPKGDLTLLVEGEKVNVVIVEKMLKFSGDYNEIRGWSAYSRWYQSGLQPSGFLRFEIKAYGLGFSRGPWIETKTKLANTLLPILITETLRAGPATTQRRKEIEESKRLADIREAERQRERLARQRDQKRFEMLVKMSDQADQAARLRGFITDLRKRAQSESDVVVGDLTIEQWLQWAEAHVKKLDPLEREIEDLFKDIEGVSPYGW